MTLTLPAVPALLDCAFPGCSRRVDCEGLTVCTRHTAHQLGITFRQLDYWARRGWLHPERRQLTRSGVSRRWPEKELAIARLMGRLTAAGFAPQLAARYARDLAPRGEIAPGIWLEVEP